MGRHSRGRLLKVVSCSLIILSISVMCTPFRFLERPFHNPPATLQVSDLSGIWEAHYNSGGVDRLVITPESTFQQSYSQLGYSFKTEWSKLRMERFPDGRVRLHLEGARYYLEGIEFAELNGRRYPCPAEDLDKCLGRLEMGPFHFYDPIVRDFVEMLGKLVLNVRSDSSGQLILMHMWTSSDDGFPIIGEDETEFHRIMSP